MRCSPSRVRGVAAGIAATALVASAGARAEPPPIRIDYHAHAGCPAAPVLLDEITRRTPLARFATQRELALEVRARVTLRGRESRGTLVLGAGKRRVVREIESASCDEIISAFALITALAVDPRASTAPRPPPALPPPTPLPPALPSPALAPPTRTRSIAAPPPADLLASPLPALLATPPLVAAPRPGFWIVGARASATFAVTPRALVGGGLFVERAFDAEARASLRLALELAATGAFDAGPAGASFWQATLRLDGCVLGQRPVARLRIAPCLRAEGGVLHASGILGGALTQIEQAPVPWLGIGIAPLLSLDLANLVVEAQGGPTFPLVRRTFRFDSPDYVIHEVPPVVWTIGLGAGIRFR